MVHHFLELIEHEREQGGQLQRRRDALGDLQQRLQLVGAFGHALFEQAERLHAFGDVADDDQTVLQTAVVQGIGAELGVERAAVLAHGDHRLFEMTVQPDSQVGAGGSAPVVRVDQQQRIGADELAGRKADHGTQSWVHVADRAVGVLVQPVDDEHAVGRRVEDAAVLQGTRLLAGNARIVSVTLKASLRIFFGSHAGCLPPDRRASAVHEPTLARCRVRRLRQLSRVQQAFVVLDHTSLVRCASSAGRPRGDACVRNTPAGPARHTQGARDDRAVRATTTFNVFLHIGVGQVDTYADGLTAVDRGPTSLLAPARLHQSSHRRAATHVAAVG